MVTRKEIRERLRLQKEIELSALHPSDRERIERIGARVGKIGSRGQKVGGKVQRFIDRRAIEGEKIMKKKIKDGLKTLIDGNPKDVKRRRRK